MIGLLDARRTRDGWEKKLIRQSTNPSIHSSSIRACFAPCHPPAAARTCRDAHRLPQTVRRNLALHQRRFAESHTGGVWFAERRLSDWPAGRGLGGFVALKR